MSENSTWPPVSDGVIASAVRNRPYTTQGWRPTSAVNQPASTATNPVGNERNDTQRNQRVVSKRPRKRSHPKPGSRQHDQAHAHHNPEGEEWDYYRRPILRWNALEPYLCRREAIRVDQAPKRRRQCDREEVSPVLDIRPGEQHLGSRLLIVPAGLDRRDFRRLVVNDIFAVEVSEHEL